MSTQATILSNARPRAWRDFNLPALRRIVGAVRRWRATRRAERELYVLSDRTLKDMGLSRWEIPSAVRERSSAIRYRPLF